MLLRSSQQTTAEPQPQLVGNKVCQGSFPVICAPTLWPPLDIDNHAALLQAYPALTLLRILRGCLRSTWAGAASASTSSSTAPRAHPQACSTRLRQSEQSWQQYDSYCMRHHRDKSSDVQPDCSATPGCSNSCCGSTAAVTSSTKVAWRLL
jgi:hypothetical protein